jgi:Outer membrane receptor proteins, mostly Fe transport
MKKLLSMFLLLCLFTVSWAQGTVTLRGTVIDGETGESLTGATIAVMALKRAVATDLKGGFSLQVPAGEMELNISCVGYVTQTLPVRATGNSVNVGEIALVADAVGLKEVLVTATMGVARKTPVAISTVTHSVIQEIIGTQELPEVLNLTPGVYATKQGGGFGDSRINIRGFESPNMAIMVNGVPVNDMEWGGVYWSNWMGLSDVARSMQTQRGLGAAKIAAPSVGGSINIVTKTTDVQREGFVYYGLANDGYNKLAFSASTGLSDKGWAITLLGSKTWGNGYILGTEFEGYTYFLNISKRINDKHELSFNALGAPQWHNQRYNGEKLLISEWSKYKEKYRYNPTYGFDQNGQRKTANYNYFHKPQISLNHSWKMSDNSSLTTVAYVSIGRGGGYAGRGRNSSALYGSTNGYVNNTYRTVDDYFDYAKVQQENAADPNGSLVAITSSTNDHNWYGLMSTFSTKLGNWDIYGGLDLRYYEGIHKGIVMDLMGGNFFIDPNRANASNRKEVKDPAWLNEKLGVGDVVYRDYTGYVTQYGLFGQAEYTKDKWSAFVSVSGNNNQYWRVDRFYYNNERSETASHLGYMVKGGANYNINDNHNVFFNVGGFSRTPFYSGGVFLSAVNSNGINTAAKNEKILSAEIGYGFRSRIFSAKLNAYYTNWYDKTTVRAVNSSNPDEGTINLQGVNATHMGVEAEFVFIPTRALEVNGMISLGDWRWVNNPEGLMYNKEGLPVDIRGNIVTDPSQQAKMQLMMEDIPVGNSAQTSASLRVNYNFLSDWRAGLTYRLFARNYASYSIPTAYGVQTIYDPWMIPSSSVFNLFLSYRFRIGNLNATLQGNVDNLFNTEYIADANDGLSHDWDTAQVLYGFGRTWSLGLRIRF